MAFRSEREGGGIFLAPAFGGRERRLTTFGFLPQWMPDGSQLLFVVVQWPECVARRSSRLSRWSRRPAAQAHPRGRPGRSSGHWAHCPASGRKADHLPRRNCHRGRLLDGAARGWSSTRVTRSPAVLANMKRDQLGWIDFRWAPAGDAIYSRCDERRRQPVEGGRRSVDARVGVGAGATDHGDRTRRRGRAIAGWQQAGVRDQSRNGSCLGACLSMPPAVA